MSFGRREPGSGLLGPGCNGRPQLSTHCANILCLRPAAPSCRPAGPRAPRPDLRPPEDGVIDHDRTALGPGSGVKPSWTA